MPLSLCPLCLPLRSFLTHPSSPKRSLCSFVRACASSSLPFVPSARSPAYAFLAPSPPSLPLSAPLCSSLLLSAPSAPSAPLCPPPPPPAVRTHTQDGEFVKAATTANEAAGILSKLTTVAERSAQEERARRAATGGADDDDLDEPVGEHKVLLALREVHRRKRCFLRSRLEGVWRRAVSIDAGAGELRVAPRRLDDGRQVSIHTVLEAMEVRSRAGMREKRDRDEREGGARDAGEEGKRGGKRRREREREWD